MQQKSENILQRKFDFEVRAEHDEKNGDYIVGRPIVYGSKTDIGYFYEIIENGALDKADMRDVRFLVNHNVDMIPLARSRNNNENSTMQLWIDAQGLNIRVNLDTENNSEAKNLYSAIKRGDITGMSFMFTINKEEWEALDSDHPTRRILEIGKVYEVSAVTFPAYEDTEISARDKKALDSAKSVLDSARSELLDSNTAELLELEKAKVRNKVLAGGKK